MEEFIASRVKLRPIEEILEGEKFEIAKERTFLVIRFLFDDILSKLNPTDPGDIEKTRIQNSFIAAREEPQVRDRAQEGEVPPGHVLVKGLSGLVAVRQAFGEKRIAPRRARGVHGSQVAEEFETQYKERLRVAEAEAVSRGRRP